MKRACRNCWSSVITSHGRPRVRADAARGVATVELALVLPLILLFAFASIDFGRIVHAYIAVSNAARCGAEYGSMHKFTPHTQSFWQSQVQAAVEEEMQGLSGFAAENLQVTIATTTDDAGLFRVRVRVLYPFDTLVNWLGLPSHTLLRHEVEMRQIR